MYSHASLFLCDFSCDYCYLLSQKYKNKNSLQIPSSGPNGRGHLTNRVPPGVVAAKELAETSAYDPLIGRKVMTRWPEDNNFYEAVITDFDAQKVCPFVTITVAKFCYRMGLEISGIS